MRFTAQERQATVDAVGEALAQVLSEDATLLELDAHELAQVHRFAVYLERGMATLLLQHSLAVDLDYDRHGTSKKVLPPRPDSDDDRRFRPDLVVHRRTSDECNLLVVEWKKHANQETLKVLEERVRLLTSSRVEGPFRYGYEIGVIVDSCRDEIRWYVVTDDVNDEPAWSLASARSTSG